VSYIESSLLDEEELVHQANLHWIIFLGPIFFIVASLLIMLISIYVGFVFFVGGLIWTLSRLLDYKFTEFGVTDRRILAKTGILQRRSLELKLSKVESISVQQSLLGRILNFGTIVVIGTGGTRQPFPQIDAPLLLRDTIQQLTEAAPEKPNHRTRH